MKNLLDVAAASIGYAAWRIGCQDQAAAVIGATSRGLFVGAAHQVVFVSFGIDRGPLTITLDRPVDRLRSLEAGAPAHFSDGRLIFPSIAMAISASPQAVWQYPLPQASASPARAQLHNLTQIAQEVVVRKRGEPSCAVLSALLELPLQDAVSHDQHTVLPHILRLQRALAEKNMMQMLDSLEGLLGWGQGLTPSGDDYAQGLLLMLNRWQRHLDWSDLNRPVIAAAYQMTTTLSANLIECAADGQADERLMKVVDGIVTGEPGASNCVDCVLDWGSSSGMDALVGMAIVITAMT